MTTSLHPSIATVADAPEIHALLLSCRESIPFVPEFAEPRYVEWVRGECTAKRFIVVRQGFAITGAMCLDVNNVLYIAVGAEYRRRGIARMLLSFAKDRCRRRRWETLTGKVHDSNAPSRAMLESEGFEPDPVAFVQSRAWSAFVWKAR